MKQEADKSKISRKEEFARVLATGLVALALAGCMNDEINRILATETYRPTQTSGVLYPGETYTLPATPRLSDSPVPSETMTPTPRESCLINGTTFTETNRHPDGGYRYPQDISKIDKPLNQWTQDEKTKIVDAAGNPIYDGVRAIANSRWVSDNRLNYMATWVGRGCGYGLMFANQNGEDVWATNILGMAMGRPDGNGVGFGAQAISYPGTDGHMELIVGREQTVVWVRGTDQIIGRYDPVTQKWNIEQAYRPGGQYELSSEQLAAKHLYGSGFEIHAQYEGIPVDFTAVTSNGNLEKYGQTTGCMLNMEMAKYGDPAEDRLAEMVLLGHYVGYLRDTGLTEDNYPFTRYIADLKAGRDRSYVIWGVKLDQSIGEFSVDPLAPIEFVVTDEVVDSDGNGKGIGLHGDNISRFGYQKLENKGIRIVEAIKYDYKNYFYFCSHSSMGLKATLIFKGLPLEFLQGGIPVIYSPKYPLTDARMNSLFLDDRIWTDSNGKLGPGVLVSP